MCPKWIHSLSRESARQMLLGREIVCAWPLDNCRTQRTQRTPPTRFWKDNQSVLHNISQIKISGSNETFREPAAAAAAAIDADCTVEGRPTANWLHPKNFNISSIITLLSSSSLLLLFLFFNLRTKRISWKSSVFNINSQTFLPVETVSENQHVARQHSIL